MVSNLRAQGVAFNFCKVGFTASNISVFRLPNGTIHAVLKASSASGGRMALKFAADSQSDASAWAVDPGANPAAA